MRVFRMPESKREDFEKLLKEFGYERRHEGFHRLLRDSSNGVSLLKKPHRQFENTYTYVPAKLYKHNGTVVWPDADGKI